MKKLTDFIIDRRYIILFIFLIMTIICVFLSNKVKINYDMANYLPSSSETRIGINIMEDEFSNKSSSVSIMLENLNKEEQKNSYNYLKKLDNVTDVEKEEKDNYTLYTISINKSADSKEASNLFNKLEKHFKGKIVDTSGSISDQNKTVLPFYIISLAVFSALIILIIMCESFVEPFLFLLSILIAVILNNGTNIIFSNVSNITKSISSILQMALSMDYSIMLMNRYRQEREKEKNKTNAMKKALNNAFKSISSSSITTIVGLLALVFMTFTIGRDLGFVLAKGVLFSLLSIFTCLPTFILLCDNLINKTKKKSPIIKLNFLGKFAYLSRYVMLLLFILVFIGSYFLKGNLGFIYNANEESNIKDVFNLNNQMAIIYPNKSEDVISQYCKSLENSVDEVLCYGNTINLPLQYNKLNSKLEDLESDVFVDEYLLKIIYYHYYNQKENNKITLDEVINFIKNNVYDNKDMNKKITNNMKNNIDRLNNFSNIENIKKKRTISEISKTLNIEEEKVKNIITYYNSKNTTTKLTINEFINFMNNNILKNDKYSNKIDQKSKNNLNKISKFTSKNMINKKIKFNEMAKLYEIDENIVNDLYIYYCMINENNEKMSISEFSSFVSDNILNNNNYNNLLDDNAKNNIKTLSTFSNKEFINTKMSSIELSNLFNINEIIINQIFISQNVTALTPYELITIMLNTDSILNNLDENTINNLKTLNFIMKSTINDEKYNYKEFSQYFSMDENSTKNIFDLYSETKLTLSPYEFNNFVLIHSNDELLKNKFSNETIKNLELLKKVMDSTINNKNYSSTELANLLSLDKDTIKLIFSLYDIQYKNKNIALSYEEFVTFLTKDVMNNSEYNKGFDNKTKNKLNIVKSIINNSLNNKKYDKDELYSILSPLTDNLDKDLIDLIYIYYGSKIDYQNKWTLTVSEFVNYLYDDILKDKRFDDYINKENIINAKNSIDDAKDLLVGKKYSRVILNTKLKIESKETFEFIQKIKDDLKNEGIYIIGDSPMSYEMSQTFQNELDFITILTMIFIFLVVAVTFKSIIIPIILVLLIQTAVFLTMCILSFDSSVYFISILIVQSILMGATIDYAILYTSYHLENREKQDIKNSIISSYNNSIHTIFTSASILIIVTLIVGKFSSEITAKICLTISEGTICSAILILLLLPSVLAACDKIINKNKKLKKCK